MSRNKTRGELIYARIVGVVSTVGALARTRGAGALVARSAAVTGDLIQKGGGERKVSRTYEQS